MKKLWRIIGSLFGLFKSYNSGKKEFFEVKDKKKIFSLIFFFIKLILILYIYNLLYVDLKNMYGVADWFVKLFVNKTSIVFTLLIIIVPLIMEKIFENKEFSKKYMTHKYLTIYKWILNCLFFIPTIVWGISLFYPSIDDILGKLYDNFDKWFLTCLMIIGIIVVIFVVLFLIWLIKITIVDEINFKRKQNSKKTQNNLHNNIPTSYYGQYEIIKIINKNNTLSTSNNHVNKTPNISNKVLVEKKIYYDVTCENCDGHMIRRQNRDSGDYFYGCSNFHSKNCKHTISVSEYKELREEIINE